MVNILFIPLLLYPYLLGVTAHNENHVSRYLFDSLEELSRLVDISYCVGTTGVQQPFQCLSRCAEFPGFELITVSAHHLHYEQETKHTRRGTRECSYPTHAATLHSRTRPQKESSSHSAAPTQ